MKKVYLYFHNDFDGVVSCVLVFHLLQKMKFKPIIEKSISKFKKWDNRGYRLKKPFASVDIPYNPDSLFYFDHHLPHKLKKISEKTKYWGFNGKAKSCAQVIYDYAKKKGLKFNERAEELVYWTNIIDSADYSKHNIRIKELMNPKESALIISLSLESIDGKMSKKIAKDLIKNSLDTVAKKKYIQNSYKKILHLKKESINEFRKNSHFDDNWGIVVYDATKFYWDRYALAEIYPKSQLWLGLTKINKIYSIKMSKNPWNKNLNKKIKNLDIGKIMGEFNGGGHKKVGAVQFNSYKKAKESFNQIIRILEKL